MQLDEHTSSVSARAFYSRSRLTYSVPAAAHPVRAVRKAIESFATDHGFARQRVQDLSLAIAEALFNAMEHGSPTGNATAVVDVDFRQDRLEVAVEDDGNHGEYEERYAEIKRLLEQEPDEAPEVDLERGRGLFLIRAKSDEVRLEKASEGGLRLVMVLCR